jgi:histidine triad (HIT) family protein
MPKVPGHCIFCDIIHGAAEVSVCYEDARALAFMDIQPVNHGHTLVVPRDHYESFVDLPHDVGLHLFEVAMLLGPVIRKVSGAEATNLIVSSGAAAGQDIYHFHIHLVPRKPGDGFDVPLPYPGSEMPDRTVLDAMAARIISALRDPARARVSPRSPAAPVKDSKRS